MQSPPSTHHGNKLFATFTGEDIFAARGRRLFYILNAFSLSGYRIYLLENPRFKELGPYAHQMYSLDNFQVVEEIPSHTEDMTYLFDIEHKRCRGRIWHKKVWVRYDIFSSYALASYRSRPPVVMPWPLHPLLTGPDLPKRLAQVRANEKRLRVFFSGDLEGYTRNFIQYPAPKLPRMQIVQTILDALGERKLFVDDSELLRRLFTGPYVNKCVIVDTTKIRVEGWLDKVSKVDFFLSPPGYIMPMCHNSVEAMAVGAVPLINYPEWFRPPLEDMKNCVVFGDGRDLLTKLDRIFTMSKETIGILRQNAIQYYENYLQPQTFVREIESRPYKNVTMLLLTEHYVHKHASKLNRHSIVLRDANRPVDNFFWRTLARISHFPRRSSD